MQITTQQLAWLKARQANSLSKELIEREFAAQGLPDLPVFEVLFALRQQPRRSKDLLAEVDVTKSGLSRLLGRIEKDALIRRFDCSEDRRCTYFELTEQGKQVLHQATVIWQEALKQTWDTVVTAQFAEDSISVNQPLIEKLIQLNSDCRTES